MDFKNIKSVKRGYKRLEMSKKTFDVYLTTEQGTQKMNLNSSFPYCKSYVETTYNHLSEDKNAVVDIVCLQTKKLIERCVVDKNKFGVGGFNYRSNTYPTPIEAYYIPEKF
jgi:hypothetical protein